MCAAVLGTVVTRMFKILEVAPPTSTACLVPATRQIVSVLLQPLLAVEVLAVLATRVFKMVGNARQIVTACLVKMVTRQT